MQVTDSAGWNATFGMHRADFVEMLASALPSGVVRTGHRGTGFEQAGEVARVSFANGAIAEGDVVIAADGIHSELRPYAAPPSRPVFHGSVAYRGVVPHERIPHWPTDRWLMWLGKGKHFLTFPVRAGKLINYVGFVPADAEMKESWSAPGDPDVLRREFAGWDPRIGTLLRQVEKTFRWALYDREPLPTWTKGRLTLLGDAAHPMLPHLGQGANQSIEDGMALATILARVDARSAPAALLRLRAAAPRAGGAGAARRARERPALRIPPIPISACATPRYRRMRRSAGGSTITTSCRKRKLQRPLWVERALRDAAVNRAITLSTVDGHSRARAAFRAFLVHPGRALHEVPRERDDFALRTCDLRQMRYTQSVRPFFRQAVNVQAGEPFSDKRYHFFRYLPDKIVRDNARGSRSDADEEAKYIRKAQAGGDDPLPCSAGESRVQLLIRQQVSPAPRRRRRPPGSRCCWPAGWSKPACGSSR